MILLGLYVRSGVDSLLFSVLRVLFSFFTLYSVYDLYINNKKILNWLRLIDWCLTALSAQLGYIMPL